MTPICLAAPRAAQRAMCRTDFCHLTSSYEHSRLVGFRCVAYLRTRDPDNRLFHVSAIRFGGPHDYLRATAAGLVFPSRCVAAEPLTSLSPPPRRSPRSRAVSGRESRRGRLPRVRVNEARERTTRDAFHLARTFAPQRPFERPALAFPCVAALPPRCRLSSPFHPRASFRIRPGRAPVHAPLCHWESRFSEPGLRLPTSATLNDARAHPTSARSSHASGAFAPLLAGTNRCQLRRPPRCVAASGACEPRPARDGSTRVAFHLRGGSKSWVGVLERRRTRVLERYRACPPRGAPDTRVTGSIRCEVWSASPLVAPAEIHLGCRPAKG